MSKRATRQAMEFGTRKSTRKGAQKKPRSDKRTMTISRQGQKDFTIKVGDEVRVWFGKNKWEVMEVVGLSPTKKKVRVSPQRAVRKGGQWMDQAYIYPKDSTESLEEARNIRKIDVKKATLQQYKVWLQRVGKGKRMPQIIRDIENWFRFDLPATAEGELDLEIYHLPLSNEEFNIVVANYGDRYSVELSVPEQYEDDEELQKQVKSKGREVFVGTREEAQAVAAQLAMRTAQILKKRV